MVRQRQANDYVLLPPRTWTRSWDVNQGSASGSHGVNIRRPRERTEGNLWDPRSRPVWFLRPVKTTPRLLSCLHAQDPSSSSLLRVATPTLHHCKLRLSLQPTRLASPSVGCLPCTNTLPPCGGLIARPSGAERYASRRHIRVTSLVHGMIRLWSSVSEERQPKPAAYECMYSMYRVHVVGKARNVCVNHIAPNLVPERGILLDN
ncbi:hypothetical protein LY76DRAFT_228357 [Colletotrichum caudatum]|nr:hypothetical protein LY76DRAFT_228357 [Colletotrichum caudatum]